MLTNYDAKAVAEVMGIGFLQGPKGCAPSPAPAPKAAKGTSRAHTAALDEDFVIRVDDTTMLIVEIKTNDTLARFKTSKAASLPLTNVWKHIVSSPTSIFIEKAVEKGLPRQALRHVAERLAGGDKALVSALEWGVVPKTTLDRRETHLSPQESERTERVARLFVHASRALGSETEARAFMTTLHPELDGRSPIDAARTDLGTRRTEQILNALEYGLAL
jgi:putative toxin-antitoxin system antitoxin component (TIGR02293 family)